MFTSRLPELLARLNFSKVAQAAGQAAVAAVRETMLTGYDSPVYRTGALLNDVSCSVEETTAVIGNTLPYAVPVHDGTCRMAGRPYLADGILSNAQALRNAAAQALRRQGL